VPSSLFVNALEVGVSQEPTATRKTNLIRLWCPRFLVGSISRHRDHLERRGKNADQRASATRSRDTILAK
jgi:hypothetical protein